jgi:hypothetical protein
MNSSRLSSLLVLFTSLLATSLFAGKAIAQSSGLHFQRPGQSSQATTVQQFRAPAQTPSAAVKQTKVAEPERAPVAKSVKQVAAKPQSKQAAAPVVQQAAAQQTIKQDNRIRRAQSESVEYEPSMAESYHEEPLYMDSMSIQQPRRGRMAMNQPGMMMGQPQMAMGSGIAEPSCGIPDCGSCVGMPGPDYWCFPVCFPRLKDMTLWAGVHGFRGPRDFIPAGQSNSNFGFQEGVNISGRAPLVGFMFPELSYQLGYQAVQSRLSGTATSSDDRGQQFVTAGLFRRTQSGLQFGAVFDSMTDDLDQQIDLNQVRYEISLKTPRGRELGFWGANSTNDAVSNGVTFATIDQYNIFYRWNFRDGYQGRIWGGVSGDGEGILGADFYAPLNDRWSVQTGFNYQIPDQNSGLEGVSQESWNLGINLVWHLGRTARKGCSSPFRPLFQVADNGWMFVDRVD